MSRAVWIGLLAGLALIAGLAWLFYGGDDDDSASGPVTIVDYTDSEAESADEEGDGRRAPPRYPLLEEPSESESEAVESKPLPELEASDESVREEASALSGAEPLESLLLPERLIERFVVTFNSLDGSMAPLSKWPMRHAEGVPEVARVDEGRFRWKPANHRRYDAYVRVFTTPDASTLVDLYIRYYPLLQEAYAALGEEEDYFNDRVIAIIDHLLEAPPARESYALRQPRVLFTFLDPELERLSPGQKILLRIGPEHSEAVRAQLRAIRAEIVARTGADDGP
ncbi:DUF3014 domain-containing protein [Algiphilus aromaticivorans]|uniref:DUF3014 domain-containing protein n=1 Tax=Algiphilus aromaticivorans TaxID=382454 RepID=UPI0006931D4B|nr:DUF3014 domain-containing protein [Algiphilus aromaticivorans]